MIVDLDAIAAAIADLDDGHPLYRFPVADLVSCLQAAASHPKPSDVDKALTAAGKLGDAGAPAVAQLQALRARAACAASLLSAVVTP